MKISVALCTYNGEKYLNQQIDSILNQSISVDEIIVCDDVSSDSTVDILNSYKEKYPNLFSIHINSVNLKSNKNFEKAIKLCNGDYIFLADQDDLWRLDKVEKTLEVFKNNENAEGVFSNAELIDDNNELLFKDKEVSLWDSVYFFESLINKPVDLYLLLILKSNYLTGATLCIKKEVKEFCFPFRTTEKSFLHDEWFALILSKRKTLYYSTEKLISYRIHSGQQVGVGEIRKNMKIVEVLPRSLQLILNIKSPRTFRDYKILERNIFKQYIKYRELNLKGEQPNEFNVEIEKQLLTMYLDVNKKMKKANPIFYFFRKWEDKRKGKRQL